nr:histidine kinase dimerization/phospho-acceptor domain-containing protein [Thermoanaerobaculia bacterium]
MTHLERQLSWYIALRLVVVTSMALPYVFSRLSAAGAGDVPEFYGALFGITCVLTLFYLANLRLLTGRPELQAWIQFVGDLLLTTGLIYRFGGDSPFSPFYVVVIIVASLLLGQRAAIVVASASFLLYSVLQIGLSEGWIRSQVPPLEYGVTLRLAYTLFVHLVGFYGVAFLTSLLTRRVKLVEDALEVQREDLAALKVAHRDIIESVPSGLATTDLSGTVTTLNRAGEMILGVGEGTLLGEPITASGLFTQAEWESLVHASDKDRRYRSEKHLDRASGRVDIGFTVSRLMDGEGRERGYIVIFQDLTRWRLLEEELRLKDRMAAVGELAAGLAHEIGNPLAAISGSVQMLAASSSAGSGEQRLLDILLKESQRLDRTIKGFLRFVRPKDRATVRFDIAGLLAENVQLLQNSPEISSRHRVELKLHPPSTILLGDPDQISQIFWNVARNALKAMPGGGLLAIEGELGQSSYTIRF